MRWTACELHTHTQHSDGDFSLEGMLQKAHDLGIEAIAITDHNAISALANIDNKSFPCKIIKGIEWTTYFGHVVVIGSEEFIDWRHVTVDNIDEMLNKVREVKGVTSMAHPFAPGDPICCGCYWEFNLKDWNLLNAIEIWSGNWPQLEFYNIRAKALWNRQLDKGFKTTGVSARDWHGGEDDTKPYGVTYLLLDESKDVTQAAKEALINHKTYFSIGPMVDFKITSNGKTAVIGDEITGDNAQIELTITKGNREHVWKQFDIGLDEIKVIGVGGKVLNTVDFQGYDVKTLISLDNNYKGWVRIEIYGDILDKYCEIAITNPIYIY